MWKQQVTAVLIQQLTEKQLACGMHVLCMVHKQGCAHFEYHMLEA